ncbi:MAG: tRNA (adenosine(37)-N6)-dimethylallyltransferase MiaA [Chlamydiia bacterium]|nr:tRNA (adenosine(37)-N6)-dimethylallyltransferase MiaA [Chlamydiia bacterium]
MGLSGISIEKDEIERIFAGLATQAEKEIPSTLEQNKKRVIILAGPTATGKSALGMELAEQMNGEIITADSMQVYKGMDIGTAKATLEERQSIPHHLLDIRNVDEIFNVVDFYYEARQSCMHVLSNGKVPIVVGGSGFYLRSLIYGPPSGPPSVPELRKEIEEEFDRMGPEFMYQKLEQLDLEYAHTITKNDRQKIVRALEIIQLTGKKVSRHSWKERRKPQNYDFRCWFLHRPKDILYRRIEKRCDDMIELGLIDEVRDLKEKGLLKNSSASQAIGYKQTLDYLDSDQSKEAFETFVREFKKASRHYAKRQLTWFRKESMFRWLDLDLHDPEVVMDIIQQDYEMGL